MRKPYLSVVDPQGLAHPPMGGYGPWWLWSLFAFHGFRVYLCVPMHMTRAELRAQYVWASERSDRHAYLPSKRFAPKDSA